MTTPMLLTGDIITPDMPMNDAQVNHLRRLLAWLRCEYMLDPHMQAGYLRGATELVASGFTTPERANGEPEAVEWIAHAYDLACEEKQVTVTQRTFTKI